MQHCFICSLCNNTLVNHWSSGSKISHVHNKYYILIVLEDHNLLCSDLPWQVEYFCKQCKGSNFARSLGRSLRSKIIGAPLTCQQLRVVVLMHFWVGTPRYNRDWLGLFRTRTIIICSIRDRWATIAEGVSIDVTEKFRFAWLTSQNSPSNTKSYLHRSWKLENLPIKAYCYDLILYMKETFTCVIQTLCSKVKGRLTCMYIRVMLVFW